MRHIITEQLALKKLYLWGKGIWQTF